MMRANRSLSMWVMVCAVLMGSVSVWGAFDGHLLRLGDNNIQWVAPYFYGDMDAAGYSDWIWYGQSPIHDYGYHEVLSGEWGAAIYYDGIDTDIVDPNTGDRQAMWLTKNFVYPNWGTNSDFTYGGTCSAWPNSSNPVPNNDIGKSVIQNNDVEVTIDYEVVDLQALGSTYSPMAFIAEPNAPMTSYILSDRYVFLQTYTFRNLDPNSTLTGLEFYQFLHSHGANEYNEQVNSTYSDASIADPLASYTPYNSVHQVGNFRYDITQWNSRPFGTATHVDYVGFSSTVKPDWIDNDVFPGHGGKPSVGGHLHVEDRQLNDANSIYAEEVSGTMGWSLGSLDPNETTSMTIAFMFAPEQESSSLLTLTKTILDANDCYSPGDELTYRISWENLTDQPAENAVLTDYLPAGLTYPVTYSFDPNFQVVSSDPNYGIGGQHTYTWNLGTIPAYGTGYRDLTVTVNEMAPPGMTVRNDVVLETSIGMVTGFHNTPICCWDTSGIIYVDDTATGANSGVSWADAYTDLQDALARARAGCWTSTEIRVAQGIYDPGREASTTFAIPDNVSVYGGYKGGLVNGNDRNPKKYVTVLTGDVDTDRNTTVVTMGDGTLISGCTITGASAEGYGIYGNGVDFTVESCTITDNDQYGIHAIDGNVSVKWCKVQSNGSDGIYHRGAGYDLIVENSWILRNGEYGINSIESKLSAKSDIVSESSFLEFARAGVRISYPTYPPVLHNNTIANNKAEGVFFEDDGTISDPNDKDYPDIQNCIVYYNSGESQMVGLNPDVVAKHCCIQDCNELPGLTNYNDEPGFAYAIDPNGTPDPNNYHLASNAFCLEKGDPNFYESAFDYDGDDRVMGTFVDIGADEVNPDCNDVSNDVDWNADGVINLDEFSKFSAAWLGHDPNDPEWDDPNVADPNLSEGWYEWKYKCNLDPNGSSQYQIDLADMDVFWREWLWQACWYDNSTAVYGMSVGGESMMMAESMTATMSMDFSIEPYIIDAEPTYPISELNSTEKTFVQILAILEQTIQQEPDFENIEGIYDIKAFLEDCLVEIRSQK